MNIYKKGKLRNLTNAELKQMLEDLRWSDKELLQEYENRFQNGRVKFKPESMDDHMRLINFVTRPLGKLNNL